MRAADYNEVERIALRMYEFGKDKNSVSAQCEMQALRIRLGWTGPGACEQPVTRHFGFNCQGQVRPGPPLPTPSVAVRNAFDNGLLVEQACRAHWASWDRMRPDHQRKWRLQMSAALKAVGALHVEALC